MYDYIKKYINIVTAAVIAMLLGLIKYKSIKNDRLKTDVQIAENNAASVEHAIEAERRRTGFESNNRVAAAKAEARDYETITDHFYTI